MNDTLEQQLVPSLLTARQEFHQLLLAGILTTDNDGVVAIADKHNRTSKEIAAGIVAKLETKKGRTKAKASGQTSGRKFEDYCKDFIDKSFRLITHVRPGDWDIRCVSARGGLALAEYEQYAHLRQLMEAVKQNPELQAALGNDYTITPDIVVTRKPLPDSVINEKGNVVDESVARRTSIREVNNQSPLLHASISCKWTIRTDRAQNARSEALNLIRNRKGRLSHIMVVTAEPTPARIASLALGTGDIDCVYHFALAELQDVVSDVCSEDTRDLLNMMVEGKRLKDIADLPLDLAI